MPGPKATSAPGPRGTGATTWEGHHHRTPNAPGIISPSSSSPWDFFTGIPPSQLPLPPSTVESPWGQHVNVPVGRPEPGLGDQPVAVPILPPGQWGAHTNVPVSGPTRTAAATQEETVGYAGDDSQLRVIPIPGLDLESRGQPITVYRIPADPRVGSQEAITHWGGATILVDGTPNCINLQDQKQGLDTWKSAGIKSGPDGKPDYNISSYNKVNKNGLPVLSIDIMRDPKNQTKWAPILQDSGPYKGWPISTTSLHDKGQYVNTSEVPGIAINHKLEKDHGVQLGDPVYVYNTENSQGAWGMVVDRKGKDRKEATEVTVAMANALRFKNPSPRDGDVTSQTLQYTYYPGAGKGPNTGKTDWQTAIINRTGQTAAWNHGFDPAKTQWYVPPPRTPAVKPPAPVKSATTTGTPPASTVKKPPQKPAAAPADDEIDRRLYGY